MYIFLNLLTLHVYPNQDAIIFPSIVCVPRVCTYVCIRICVAIRDDYSDETFAVGVLS